MAAAALAGLVALTACSSGKDSPKTNEKPAEAKLVDEAHEPMVAEAEKRNRNNTNHGLVSLLTTLGQEGSLSGEPLKNLAGWVNIIDSTGMPTEDQAADRVSALDRRIDEAVQRDPILPVALRNLGAHPGTVKFNGQSNTEGASRGPADDPDCALLTSRVKLPLQLRDGSRISKMQIDAVNRLIADVGIAQVEGVWTVSTTGKGAGPYGSCPHPVGGAQQDGTALKVRVNR